MSDSKTLLDSFMRGETNIKHKTVDTITLNSNSKYGKQFASERGVELTARQSLCEGPLGPARSQGVAPREKVIGIGSDHKPLTRSDISYAALTLHKPNPKKLHDNRQKVNLDFVVNESTTFNKLMFSLTQKDSEFYGNLPDDWQQTPAYGDAFEFYKELKALKMDTWIGKGCIRQTYKKGRRIKSKMRLGTAMVLYKHQGAMHGRCWIESAVFEFEFDQVMDNALYSMKSEPFEVSVVWDESPWL